MTQMSGSRSAVVIGGGIGGLSAAVGLNRIGWHVTVLEQAPLLREVGAGISLMANAQRSLDRLGVGAAVRAAAAPMLPGGEGIRAPSGRRLMYAANAKFVARHGLSAIVLLRPELHRVLRTALPDSSLRTGAKVTGVITEPGSAGARVVYHTDGTPRIVEADLVIGADGLNSLVRRLLWPHAPAPSYSGHSVWRGITAIPFTPPEKGGNTWGRGKQFGRMPLADGRVYWYAVANTPVGARNADELHEVRRRFGSWHHPIPALIEATPPDTVLHHDVFELATPLPRYVAGHVALLGDAAHAMTSDLGQGACQALEDAVVLCAALAAEPDVHTALARYDEQRRPRTQMITEASRRMGRMTLLDRRLAVLARNIMVRVMPPSAGERRLAQIGDWHPPELTRPVAAQHTDNSTTRLTPGAS